ncbi:ATP-dependent RNA helicase HrpA [Tessaracoccus sp. ZS01]|uniref:ATP-dependent RNA helicase HrpA n=1 Tax=Tessaracoccus sp. ZS01 TaxID=1906324 RepID=UPI00096CEF31|nr:ATP-dependent RNA helicase HrpA [Tessaracoccus sp. ZS01]MCG6568348.1 ATP-dependent RNA helicase HrpA [Tessaracoccus sp. ZS01]OMG53315.1 ATP-dependent RNA helicase HrpA [Tessaracoccus sp. ZS01]
MTEAPTEPTVEVDPQLPIAAETEHIAELIRRHQVVVVAGETGSGKTTQLPKICLMAGRTHIAHTQPRRIAARTVAQRIADECGVELGDFVGYQVRFTRKVTAATRIKVMTDGILLSELTHDRLLSRYDTIIIDEAHERSLNIDFLLGYLKQLLPKRPELRVIVTSATIDTARFSEHFGDAPVVEVSGRTYPVDTRYRPLDEGQDEIDGIVGAVEEILTEPGGGDILVFLSGEREIRDAAEAIEGLGSGLEVLPLFARLSAADQQKVFSGHSRRRVVLATNVAETSITVPRIRYVIDTGLARISRYSTRTKVQRLPIEPVSQASANQRAGRCGRLGPGIAIRLYSEEDFESRPKYSDPEILRTNLATVILLMAQAGLGDVESFPFVEAPVLGQINDGVRVLSELGAIHPRPRHAQVRLTRTGRMLARMPVDPRLGRMIIEGARRRTLATVLVLVAGLTVPDIRERPAEFQNQADQLHRRFWGIEAKPDAEGEAPKRHTAHTGTRKETAPRPSLEGGDFEALLNIWNYLHERRRELSGNQFRRMCRAEHLNFVRFREWEDLVSQLREAAKELDLDTRGHGPTDQVLSSLLSGLLSNVGVAEEQRGKREPGKRRPLQEYQGTRGARFAIQPGSALAKSTPPLVMAFELVETSRLWARTVAGIKPEWVEEVAGPLLTRTVSEPVWSQRSASVVANERLTLFGVPIVAGRRTDYAKDHPEEAREIFLRTALVEGEWDTRNPVVRDNRAVIQEAEKMTDRMRRPDLLISDEALYAFYDARVPSDVVSGATFDKWLRSTPKSDWPLLMIDDAIVDATQLRPSDFPDRWTFGEHKLPIDYTFDPGAGSDGVTLKLRLELLGQLDADEFSWQVPGLRRELATELIRSLPKSVRTNFVPAPDFAARALAWLEERGQVGEGAFPDALARALTALTGVVVEGRQFAPEAVGKHLRPTYVVLDEDREVARDVDLEGLRRKLSPKVAAKLTASAGDKAATGQKAWTFGDVPREATVGKGVVGYPALVDEATAVGLRVFDSAARAEVSHAQGVRRLLTLTNPDPTKWVVSHLGRVEKLALADSAYPKVPELLADAWLKAGEQLALQQGPLDGVRTEADYRQVALEVRQECPGQTLQVVNTAAHALTAVTQARILLGALPASDALRSDVSAQLDNLFFNRFISATPDPWFAHLPRYAQAAVVRLQAAAANRARDDKVAVELYDVEDAYAELTERQPPGPLSRDVEEIAFLIEEFRVSLFAQQLRTAVPVSAKRIRQAIRQAG